VRILHVDPERGWGGGEVQVVALVQELGARGHASTVAAHPAGPLGPAAAAAGARVVPLPIANHLDVRAALALRRLAPGFDVVHFHTARAHALAPLSRGRGARLVVTRRMDYVPAGGPWARFLYNRAVDAVIAISEGVRAALLRAGVRAERIRVVPSGIDAHAFSAPPEARASVRREWGLGDDEVAVVVMGALEARKGHGVLLAAAAALASAEPRLRYVFCGEGREAKALAAAAGLGGAALMVGFRRDVAACLAAADIVALPSLQEGLGVAALEAMAAGRPVVASRVGGLGEAVVHEETGLLVAPGDPTVLAAALARLAGDPGLRARLGAGGRARVLAHYTAARMAEGTLACYEDRPCA
jgi:glycosyltransferase involved in cell wall biosynthesis